MKQINIFGKPLTFVTKEAKRQLRLLGRHNHIIFAYTNNQCEITAVIYNKETKNETLNIMRSKLRKIDGYISVNEAWYVNMPKNTENIGSIIPSEHPNKQEALVIIK